MCLSGSNMFSVNTSSSSKLLPWCTSVRNISWFQEHLMFSVMYHPFTLASLDKIDYLLYPTVTSTTTPTTSNMMVDMLSLATTNVTRSLNPTSNAALLPLILTKLWRVKSSTAVTAPLEAFIRVLQQSHWPRKHQGKPSIKTCINHQLPTITHVTAYVR